MRDVRIAVVGATGAVGSVTMRILRERGFEQVRALASARSAGSTLGDGTLVEEATPEALAAGDVDIALFSVGTAASRELAAGIGFYGTAVSVYRRWLRHGRDITFPKDNRINIEVSQRLGQQLSQR